MSCGIRNYSDARIGSDLKNTDIKSLCFTKWILLTSLRFLSWVGVCKSESKICLSCNLKSLLARVPTANLPCWLHAMRDIKEKYCSSCTHSCTELARSGNAILAWTSDARFYLVTLMETFVCIKLHAIWQTLITVSQLISWSKWATVILLEYD